MGLLNTVMADDASAFVDLDEFGEPIGFLPRGATTWLTINALVIRDPPEFRPGLVDSRRPKMVIYFRNHATLGRTSINSGGDKVRLAYRLGGTEAEYLITAPVTQDSGLWQVEVA